MSDDRRQSCLIPRGDSRLFAIALRRAGHQRGFDLHSLLAAILLASQVHRHQCRSADGQPFVVHPLQVALVVCLWGGSEADVLAAVLHDTAEDGAAGVRATLGHIGDLFGDAVARRVSVLTKNRTIADPAARAQDHAARVLAALRDIGPGVAAIRLADRLHNCVTSAHLDAARLHALHAHTAQHLAPLAQRLQLPALAGFLGDAPGTWQAVAPAQFVPAMLALQPPWLAAADTAPAASARLAAAWPRDAMAC